LPIVVQKYGGSSVADVQKMQKVADRIANAKAAGKDVVVVVSAMGDTTDDLLALAKQVCESPARRELDMLLSAGERISMALLSMALNARGVPAVSFTGSQSGIVTNDAHTNARIVEVRPFRVQDELAQGKVVIVAGYQGVSYRRDITTLGRGGSDTTAVALAAALEADCEIYSDVEGVYTADPRVVPGARRLAELSYEEMQELAESGAKVLNAQAVEFAKELKPTVAMFFPMVPFPGTAVWKPEFKPARIEDWRKYLTFEVPPFSLMPGFSPVEVKRMADRATTQFYMRPSQLWRMFRSISTGVELMEYLRSGYGVLSRMIR
jgi:aspartokinase